MIEVNGDAGPPMADLDLVPATLTAGLTVPRRIFSTLLTSAHHERTRIPRGSPAHR